MRGPKRRDIGHGALAERALLPVMPTHEEFPYTIRAGLRDARVERLVVDGLGLRLDARADGCRRADQGAGCRHRDGPDQGGRRHVVLTDIQGAEDHLGDMDFKVAGTADGITAMQMDIKITGVTKRAAAARPVAGQGCPPGDPRRRWWRPSPEPRAEVNANAPRASTSRSTPEQIGMVIGKGGETIRGLEEEFDGPDRHPGGRPRPDLRVDVEREVCRGASSR